MNDEMPQFSNKSDSYRDAEPLLLENQSNSGDDDAQQGLWTMVNDRLTGRWKFAIPLGIVLAGVLGYLGYHSTEPKYESSGMIRVAPMIVPIMRETAETGVMPFYSSFVQTQARLISSPRVVQRAIQRMDLTQTPWSNQAQATREIQRNLSVRADRQSELIMVTFQADRPEIAQTVVNEVTRAFDELYGGFDSDEHSRKMQTLRNIREDLRNQLRQKRTQRQELISSTDYAVTSFESLIEQIAMNVNRFETEKRELERQLDLEFERDPSLRERFGPTADEQAGTGEEQDMPLDVDAAYALTDAELEAFDPELASLAQARRQARTAFQRAEQQYGERHRMYISARVEYEFAQEMYNQQLPLSREAYLEAMQAGTLTSSPAAAESLRIPQMMDRVKVLADEIQRQRTTVRELSTKQLTMNDLRSEEGELEQELAETNARIRELEIESDSIRHGRISIAQMGDLPTAPSRDQRNARMAAGAVAGMGAGLGLFFLLGSLDRRAYGVSQLRPTRNAYKLLGILPALGKSGSDFESSAVAAHCVHQIRNQLESDSRGLRHSPAITISSPSQGDGKTSLTLALGTSYATAGYRTLLIDCDLIGENLSSQCSLKLHSGLREALASDVVDEQFIHSAPLPNLHVMPCGNDPLFGPERVRRRDVAALLEKVRDSFDIILLDTGPMLGSVESLPVALASDGVVLAMWRGRRQSRLEDTIESIRRSGARCMGVVLNYARSSDCSYYVSKSNVSKALTAEESGSSNGTQQRSVPRLPTRNAVMNAMQVANEKK